MLKYIHTQTDEYGDVVVLDDEDYRILSFTVGDEQSRQYKPEPHVLQHEYTQAMMLPCLFMQPKRVLMLGLGAGALLNALHHSVPGVRIEAVELRQSVIDIAKRYFRLAQSKKIAIHCDDAVAFVKRPLEKKVDLILTDLYTEQGMESAQICVDYLASCKAKLKNTGWLVINCWGTSQQHADLFTYLNLAFADVRSCQPGDGNLVIYAGVSKCLLDDPKLREQAKKLQQKLGFSLEPFIAKLTRHQ